ncbi:MAG TPA: beta-propeller domain-containing protein, partial [Nitrospiraceae bacterium]|nr:beta-propeller domain-containing protein [Nitrospiraceae bacterium]
MKTFARATLLSASALLAAGCGGGGGSDAEQPLNTDYSALRIAASSDASLIEPSTNDALLNPLRNGVRMSLSQHAIPIVAGTTAPSFGQSTHSTTTVQVAGVDEADLVKYDGRHMFTVRTAAVPAKPGFTRNVLKIARTDPATATLEVTSEFDIAGEQSSQPLIYQVSSTEGATEYLAAVSQDY